MQSKTESLKVFFLGVAASALVIFATQGMVPGSNNQAHATNNGAAGPFIAVTTGDGQRMYLVDTEVKAIMVYEATSGARGFNLVAGRSFELDREFMRKRQLPYLSQGYDIDDIQKKMALANRQRRP